jgi:ABC-2 type transport system ATP-binding protein
MPAGSVPARGPHHAVEVSHLRKAYGETVAVDDVSFSLAEGEIFGLLGPNGAGKTTTVECAVGLRIADSGSVTMLGLDPTRERARLRSVVGVQLQASALPARLKVGELLDLYRSFYPEPADTGELARVLGLADKNGDYYRSLSGGQKQRLAIALGCSIRARVGIGLFITGIARTRRRRRDRVGDLLSAHVLCGTVRAPSGAPFRRPRRR